MKQIKLPARMVLNNGDFLDGTLSIHDGYFKITPNVGRLIFIANANIEFSYGRENHSFPVKNLGGQYFIANHQTNETYQKLVSMITLNEELATPNNKSSVAKKKI